MSNKLERDLDNTPFDPEQKEVRIDADITTKKTQNSLV